MRAGLVVMEKLSDSKFLEEVTVKGEKIVKSLNSLKERVSIIGEVRGKGLMIGCEFVNPKGERDLIGSYPSDGDIATLVQNECFKRKLIIERGGRNGSVLRFLAPLNIAHKEIDEALLILENVIMEIDQNV